MVIELYPSFLNLTLWGQQIYLTTPVILLVIVSVVCARIIRHKRKAKHVTG